MPIVPRISLNKDVEIADTSLIFQAITLIGGIITMAVSCILREQLAGTLTLDDCEASSLLQTKIAANIIIFVALIYFFLLSVQTLQEADTPCDRLSAKVNLMISFLVLAASALRLYDLTAIIHKPLNEFEELEFEDPLI